MFRRRPTPPTASPTPGNPYGVHIEARVVANPDTASINRERSLRSWTGRTLQGQSGLVVDYDRGDPAHSYTSVVQGTPQPADALARIGIADANRLPNPEAYDQGTTDAELTAYQAAMLARITR